MLQDTDIDENGKPRGRVESAQAGSSETIRGQGLLIGAQPRLRHSAQARIRRFHAAQSHLLQQLDQRIGLQDNRDRALLRLFIRHRRTILHV